MKRVEIAVCLKCDVSCVSILCRTAKLDLTLQTNKKHKLFKKQSMRKSTKGKAGMVSEIFTGIFGFKNRRKSGFTCICFWISHNISLVI